MQKGTRERTLVLSMIVKNESRVIARCLDSVLPFVDAYVIVDTGSTDNTKELIEEAGKRHRVRGLISTDEWKNFGHNRSRAAELTLTYAKKRGFALASTYMLLVDADMVLRSTGFERKELTEPMYYLEQRAPGLSWSNTRLCRLDHKWESVGVTHEFWRATPNVPLIQKPLGSLWLEDLGDGGAKGNKAERDIALLEQGLKDEPDNVRYMFYLAQTFSDVRRYTDAIPLYKKRAALGGWEEECWYCLYKIGLCELQLGHDSEGTLALIKAFQRRPARAEPLAALAEHFRSRSENHAALVFARAALRIPLSTDSLFVETLAHTRRAREEIAISAFYTGDHAEGMAACESLLDEHHDTGFHEHIARCASFYVRPIGALAIRKGDFTIARSLRTRAEKFWGLAEPSTTEYLPSNPTIVRHDDKIFVNVRLVNYYHERGRVFASKDPDSVIRTRNVILSDWKPESPVLHEVESEVELPDSWDHNTMVRGLEDQRWTSYAGRIWLTSTCFNIPGANGMPRVILGRLSAECDRVDYVTQLNFPPARQYEKNWLPWNRNGKFVLIYGYNPFVLLDVERRTGDCKIQSATAPPFPTARWRGSAAPVPLPGHDRWLAMIHETAWFDERSVYMHRFIEIKGDEITRHSPLFTFEHAGVEYAAGLLRLEDSVIVTHSIEESSAHWKEFSLETIEKLLGGAILS